MYVIGKIEFLTSDSSDKTALTITHNNGTTEDYTIYNPIIPQILKESIEILLIYFKNVFLVRL